MPKRHIVLLVAGASLLALALLLPSFTLRAIACGLILVILGLILFNTLRFIPSKQHNRSQNADVHNTQSGPQGGFASSKLFEATMNGMREGLIVVDRDMKVVASNPAAHRLFDPARGNLDSQRLTELTRNPAIYGAFLDALQGTERSGVKVETHGAERLIFDLRVVPLSTTTNGTISTAQGALGVFIDVTRLERLEQMRQEFLSNVSHELRTPLTAILAFIETLEAGALEDKEASQRFLAIIRRNTLRMNELIEDILELSAIETGNVQVRAQRVELAPLVSEVISSLANKAQEREVVVTNGVSETATVMADPKRLEQMLTNLIENAIKFNRQKGTVKVRFEKADRDRIIVEDSGEGIPAQHVERLFERFYRADRARSREQGGIGLGLAIVKHLARAHGGEVTVTSQVGKGSTFTIELP
jgi:two-component system phosphate regulon sensor histidine kinase PhoR